MEGAFGTGGGWRGLTQTGYCWRAEPGGKGGGGTRRDPHPDENVPTHVNRQSSVSHSFTSAPHPERRLLLLRLPPQQQSWGEARGGVGREVLPGGTSTPSGPNNQSRAESRLWAAGGAQLDAVAMAFFSCWQRISRVRDSSSKSWQVLHTSTGSYSCWSGMGSFRWQQSLQNTLPQFLWMVGGVSGEALLSDNFLTRKRRPLLDV